MQNHIGYCNEQQRHESCVCSQTYKKDDLYILGRLFR